jgi:hypothetical protein
VKDIPVPDIDAISTNARPPSSALVRTCQNTQAETGGLFAAAYQRFWQKSFVLDLRNVVLLDRYMDCVPTAWIRSYILIFDSSENFPPAETVLSRSGRKWQASERTEYVPQRGNIGSRIAIKMVLKKAHRELQWFNTHMLYVKPARWCMMSEKTPMKKRANKKFARKDNKLKTKSMRAQSKAFKA